MAPRKRILPNPLPDGCILTDTEKKKWRVGKMIGKGGFGLIYLASRYLDEPVQDNTDYVVKVEYLENGPLFSELKFYQRAAKPETINKWKRVKKLDFLGIPAYFGSGLSEHNGTRYRFMVMERLGSDLQKVLVENGGQLKKQTVLQLGCLMLDVLEYIHDNEYVHADIKAANLLLGHRDPGKVYLADYGLSYRYCPNGEHKDYKENPKKGHNGTIEYTSIDAHRGVAPSRRGDLEVLGYCLLHWQCGTLPWLSVLKNPVQVQEAKANLTANLPDSVIQMSTSGSTSEEVARFLLAVRSLGYKEKPDYRALKTLLWSGASSRGPLDLSRPRARATEAAGAAANGKSSRDRAAARSTAPKPATEDDCTNRAKVQSTPAKVRSRTKGEWTPEQTLWKPKTTSKKPIRSRSAVTETDEEEEEGAAAELVPPRYHPKTREGTKQRQKQEQFAPVHGAVMRTEMAFTPRTKLRNVPEDRRGFGAHVNDRRERSCYSWEEYHTRHGNEEEEEYWGKPMQAHNHGEEDQYTYDYSYDQCRYSTMNSTDPQHPQNQSHVFMRSIRALGAIVIAVALLLFLCVVILI